jgi:hypothetical protein
LLAKRPVTADTHARLNAWSSRASSLPQVMGSAWVKGLPGFRVRRKYTTHGLREQAPSHRLWVRRGLKACPGFASGANTQRICAGFRLSMHRPPPWRRCVSVMASFGGYGLLRRGRMDNQRQMPWHYSVGGSLLAKRPVTADTHARLNAWSSRASSLPQVMGSAWVKGLPGFRVRRKYTEDLCWIQTLNAPPRTVAQVCE